MEKKEYIVNDNIVIPDYIKKMTKEELENEIARLEMEHLENKQNYKKMM